MTVERIKAAMDEMQAIVEELKREYREHAKQQSAWYNEQLIQNQSGLSTNEEFDNETWKKYQELSSQLDSVACQVEFGIRNLDKAYEGFLMKHERLCETIRSAKNRVPEGWMLWKVEYSDTQCNVNQFDLYYAPNAGEAAKMCKKHRTYEHDSILVVKVRKV